MSLPDRAGPSNAATPVPLSPGQALPRIRRRMLLWAAVIAVAVLGADYGIGLYQRSATEARQAARTRLERAALFNLRADLADVAMLQRKEYRLTLKLENPFPETDLYVMTPEVQVYTQEGTVWREIPSQAVRLDHQGSVIKLTGSRTFDYVAEATIAKFEELIPGYMHVRIQNMMYVSPRSEPQRDEIVERVDNYYVYLKPHGADEREILKKNDFPDGHVPLWIPMPPH